MFYSFREREDGGREFVPGPLPVSQGDENFYAVVFSAECYPGKIYDRRSA